MGHRDRAGADDQGVKLRPRMAPNVSGERVDLSQQKVSCTNLLIFEPTHEAPSVRVKARVTSVVGRHPLPRISDRGRVAAGVSTLTLVLTILMIQVTAAVPASAAVLVVVPSAGTGGLPATVTGSGFEDERVNLCWDKAGCSNLGQETPEAGIFTTTIIIPEDAVSGSHLIYACQSGVCSSAAIEVVGPIRRCRRKHHDNT